MTSPSLLPSSLLFQWCRGQKIRFKGYKLLSCIHCLVKAIAERESLCEYLKALNSRVERDNLEQRE